MPESQSRLERINEQYKKQISQIINYELRFNGFRADKSSAKA